MSAPVMLKVKIEGRLATVPRAKYVTAKRKQLVEFGYTSLTDAEVEEQIEAIIAGKKFGDGLTIIGKFMEGEIVK